jgi:hypothetical protein
MKETRMDGDIPLSKHQFRARYGDKIRVNVDWQRFMADERIVLRPAVLRLPHDLACLWTPWFPGGGSHHPSDPAAAPLSVLGAAADLDLLGEHGEGVREHIERDDHEAFDAPALAFPRGRHLLLDRNHSTVAAAVKQTERILHLAVIVTPPDVHILTDLPRLD